MMEKLIFLVFVLIAKGNTLELVSNKVIYEDRESLRRWRGVKNMQKREIKKTNAQISNEGSRQKFYNDKLYFS